MLVNNIPLPIASLLVAYFCHTATKQQRLELDEWICKSDDNMRVFEACVEASLLQQQFDPDRYEPLAEKIHSHLN